LESTPDFEPEEQQILDDFEVDSLRSVASPELFVQLRAAARSTGPIDSENASVSSSRHDPGERPEPEATTGRSWESFFLDGPHVSDAFLEDRGCQEQADREPL
jgi:hypothetical protein